MQPESVSQLEALGLSRNEALAYLSLLQASSEEGATGYEVAATSGVPRSAVYTVLGKLEEGGAVFRIGDKPARYVPTDPDHFIAHLRRRSNAHLDRAAESLRRLPRRSRPEPIWSLSRYDEVIDRIDQMVRSASECIYLSIWSRELEAIRPALAAVQDRALHRVLHSPEALAEPPPHFACWCDDLAGDLMKATWSHKVLVVVDRRAALIGGAEPDVDNHAVWTSNPSIIDVATNHIVLDITRLATRAGRDCSADVSPMMRPHLAK